MRGSMVEWLALGCVRVCVFVFPSAVGLLGPARCAAQRAASGVEWSGSRFGRGRVLLSGRSPPFRVYFLFHEYIESCCRVGPHRFASIFCLTNIYIYSLSFSFSSLPFFRSFLSHTLFRARCLSPDPLPLFSFSISVALVLPLSLLRLRRLLASFHPSSVRAFCVCVSCVAFGRTPALSAGPSWNRCYRATSPA